jgi:hypothetical protein
MRLSILFGTIGLTTLLAAGCSFHASVAASTGGSSTVHHGRAESKPKASDEAKQEDAKPRVSTKAKPVRTAEPSEPEKPSHVVSAKIKSTKPRESRSAEEAEKPAATEAKPASGSTKVERTEVTAKPASASTKVKTAEAPTSAQVVGAASTHAATAKPAEEPAKQTSSRGSTKITAPTQANKESPTQVATASSPTIKATSKKGEAQAVGSPSVHAATAPKSSESQRLSCELVGSEAPRGGEIKIKGDGLGQTPVIKIAGKAARIIRRHNDEINVQVSRTSNGGPVVIQANGKNATCGELRITGRN